MYHGLNLSEHLDVLGHCTYRGFSTSILQSQDFKARYLVACTPHHALAFHFATPHLPERGWVSPSGREAPQLLELPRLAFSPPSLSPHPTVIFLFPNLPFHDPFFPLPLPRLPSLCLLCLLLFLLPPPFCFSPQNQT